MKPLILQPRRIGLAIRLRDRSNDNPNMLKLRFYRGVHLRNLLILKELRSLKPSFYLCYFALLFLKVDRYINGLYFSNVKEGRREKVANQITQKSYR